MAQLKLLKSRSMTDFILMKSVGHESDVALISAETGEEWTYGDVRKHIHSIGSALHRFGLKKGDVMALCAPNSLEQAALLLSVPAIGGIVTAINPIYTPGEIIYQVKDCGATYLAVAENILPKINQVLKKYHNIKKVFVIGNKSDDFMTIQELMADDGAAYPDDIYIDLSKDIAMMPYSSGTTGLPKGVLISHWAIMAQIKVMSGDMAPNFALLPKLGVVASMFPLFHIAGYGGLLVSLYNVCKYIMVGIYDLKSFLGLIQKYKVEDLFLAPSVVVQLAKDPLVDSYDLTSLCTIVAGTAPVGKTVQEEIAVRLNIKSVRQAYGMTELCGGCHISPLDRPAVPGSAGVCIPSFECKIVDVDSGQEVGPNVSGEIWVKTPCVMIGYNGAPEKTAATIDSDGWLHTGDVGYVDVHENLFVVDRLKELIKYKGFQVAPAELESLLLGHPDIADVAVIGVPDERAGEIPRAYVVLKEGRQTSSDSIAKFVKERAAAYKQLRGGVIFRKTIPKLSNGKIHRRTLRDEMLKETKSRKSKI